MDKEKTLADQKIFFLRGSFVIQSTKRKTDRVKYPKHTRLKISQFLQELHNCTSNPTSAFLPVDSTTDGTEYIKFSHDTFMNNSSNAIRITSPTP